VSDLAWIGTAVTALAGFGGVVYLARTNSRREDRRLSFEESQAKLRHETTRRDLIRETVGRIVDTFAEIEKVTWRESEPDYIDDGRDWDEGFYETYWDERRRLRRRDVALVSEVASRETMETAIETISWAWTLLREGARTGSVASIVRTAADLGFNAASAWLREDPPPEQALALAAELREQIKSVQDDLDERQEMEEKARAEDRRNAKESLS